MPINASFGKADFPEVANYFLNRVHLVANGTRYRPLEVEFYLRSEAHPDDYTHQNPDQLEFGLFYFHKFGNGSYKAGTFKGMDFTFGDQKRGIYLGVLLRAMKRVADGAIFNGPCVCVNEILSTFGVPNIKELMAPRNHEPFRLYPGSEDDQRLQLEDLDEADYYHGSLFRGPRIGLSDKYPEYAEAAYRYLVDFPKAKQWRQVEQVDSAEYWTDSDSDTE